MARSGCLVDLTATLSSSIILDMDTTPAFVRKGQRYIGWGKTWEVTRVWEREGVAEIRNVDNHANTGRHPLTQFKHMEQA